MRMISPKIKLVKPLQLFMRTGFVRALPLLTRGDAIDGRVLRHGWIEIEWPHEYSSSSRGNAPNDAMNMNILLHARLSGIRSDNDREWFEEGKEKREVRVGDPVYFFMMQTELLAVRLGEPKFMALNVSPTMSTIITIDNAPVFSSSMPCGTKTSPGI